MSTRITQDGDATLIEDRPLFLPIVLGGTLLFGVWLLFEGVRTSDTPLILAALFMAGCGWAGFHKAARTARLTLHPDGSATLRTRDGRGTTVRNFAPGILRAGVETHRDGEGESYRAVLLIDDPAGRVERLPFTPHFSSGPEGKRTVRTVMDWRETTA